MKTFNHTFQWLRRKGIWVGLAMVMALPVTMAGRAVAAGNDFNIQVSPSPLTVTLTPGQRQTTTLTVRNLSNHTETLYPVLRGFITDKATRNVSLVEAPPAGMADWVHFGQSSLMLIPGSSQQLTITFNTPTNVGFNYQLAIQLSRSTGPAATDNIQVRGSVAVFCLVNINRPDAKRQFSITSLTSSKGRYAYLPATFNMTVANTGNVIDQPKGTLFIQREFNDDKPIETIPINQDGSYILPDTSRDFTASWQNVFPVYRAEDGKTQLSWNWKHLSDLRFGKYVAKAVLVYNDGQRDVPVIASTTFWVVPWTLILVGLLVVIVLVMGVVGWSRVIVRGTKKVRSYARHRK